MNCAAAHGLTWRLMCGIAAVVRRRSTVAPPDPEELLQAVDDALAAVGPDIGSLNRAAELLEGVNARLKGVAGVKALIRRPQLDGQLRERMEAATARVAAVEGDLDAQRIPLTGAELEAANAALVRLRDVVWAIGRDRLRAACEVAALAGDVASDAALEAFWSVQVALSSLERLEVRGRDSAGLHLLVTGHGLEPFDPDVTARAADPLFR